MVILGWIHMLLLLLLTNRRVMAAWTPSHAPGVCAMRGQCATSGFVKLPCVDNGPATEPSDSLREQLVATCGAMFESGPVCCDGAQWNDLVEQVKRAEPIIMSCPACWRNFLQFWCSFTCSPDQSTFVNITRASQKDDAWVVEETQYWVGDSFGTGFYNSCKDIKFGSSNGYAMDFIGGGATNWLDMLRYMGMKRPLLGSPIQIDFPSLQDQPAQDMVRLDQEAAPCSSGDYRCACVDCESACPVLPPTPHESECHVGALRCWSFAMVTTYGAILLLVALWFVLQRPPAWLSQWLRGHAVDYDQYEPVALTEEPDTITDDDQASEDDNDDMLLDPDHTPRHYWLNTTLQKWFYRQGLFCAQHPWLVIVASLFTVMLCSSGWSHFAVERDPINLWVSPTSQALADKRHFDTHFSPFYRTTQLFVVANDDQPVLTTEHLEHLFDLESEIRSLASDKHGVKLQDVCFHPNGDACIVQSVTGYWQGDKDMFDPSSWKDDLDLCTSQPSLCLPEFQQPLKPQMLLGGYEAEKYLTAKALVVTFVLANSLDEQHIVKAQDWERSLLSHVLSVVNDRPEWQQVRISYSTESSLEQELNKSSNTDAGTVVISYVVMFLYASLALGKWSRGRRWLVESKFSLGICGILIVIFSVSSSVGLFSLTGRKTTLIIAEVIPFLVLAVGVDNIFILCHEFRRRQEQGDVIEQAAAKTLGKMGPSILLSSLSETIAFGLGSMVSMPAVSSFALVAALAVFIDFVLQVTCFVSCMVLDAQRAQSHRADCFPCVRVQEVDTFEDKDGWIDMVWKQGFVPMVLHPGARWTICLGFLGLWMANLALVPRLPLGLDQRIALPSDSYLVPYFNDLDRYFNVGPPVYFVVQNANLTSHEVQPQVCGRFPGCNDTSLANVLEQERKRPQVSYIGEPTSVWLDDFLQWLSPSVGCCRKQRGKTPLTLCGPWDDDDQCEPCYPDWSITDMDSFPQGSTFLDLFSIWINMAPDEDCPLGGKAAYGDAVVVSPDSIDTSHFRTFHTPLRSQNDFIRAFAASHRIADELSTSLQMQVYPYSVFYVFFEQYAEIVPMAFQLLGCAVAAIFLVTTALLGSLRCGAIVMLVVGMILTDVVGTMVLWDISLNAVSLVNLVICVGISVEFCCHIARGFMVASGSLLSRSRQSLQEVGSSVFSGITLTKFAGIVVLAFTRSKIFEIYYFRMYLSIVIYGALHGLILLPVLLGLAGGKGMSILSDFDQEGIVHHQGLLTEDRDSFDQVLITDMPSATRQ
ncbi:multidrug efflux transporter AcrB transmembrane domain-containing protein [Hesseltinella vesiculosa]|uniref:Multidrug efflux transporter AcrB transmembrane domain-containing protein n=1 Tax=Hesseltinella vesiculosa TaxID=101127 RepID=A0A1X2GVW6_9FUNG|nr:multidrug efflux transporter AcrB transmembrane domain-containing protein [Hesseltinella vesiculosa]